LIQLFDGQVIRAVYQTGTLSQTHNEIAITRKKQGPETWDTQINSLVSQIGLFR